MPRISNRLHALRDIQYNAQVTAACITIIQSKERKRALWKSLNVLVNVHSIIESNRYLTRGGGAGHHDANILENIIYQFSDEWFLTMFRIHRPSFWQLGTVLENAGNHGYWDGRDLASGAGGREPRPPYQQIATALYILVGAKEGRERSGVHLNLGKGTIDLYLWRTIHLLVKLLPEYVRWPSKQQRLQIEPPILIFQRCVSFLNGSNIGLPFIVDLDTDCLQ